MNVQREIDAANRRIQEQIDARCVLVPEAGHDAQHQAPDVVASAMLDFLASTEGDARA